RFAVDGDRETFKAHFPLLYKTENVSGSECLRNIKGDEVRGTVDQNGAIKPKPSGEVKKDSDICVTSASFSGGFQSSAITHQDTNLVTDPHYLTGPACIICNIHGKRELNPNLKAGW